MIEFIFNNYTVNMILFVYICVGLVLHIVFTSLNVEYYKKVGFYAEIAFMAYIVVLTLMPLISAFDKRDGIINTEIYNILAYVFGGITILLFAISIVFEKDYKSTLPIIIILLTMPYICFMPFGTFTCAYIISSFAIILRSIYLIKLLRKELKEKSINLLTSEGIDSLDSGILFCNENGYVYLCNKKMQEIMIAFGEKVQNNGDIFWNDIKNSEILGYEREVIGSEILLRSKNHTLRFEKNFIKIKTKKYYEIICSDITNLDNSILSLKRSQVELAIQEKELLNFTNQMIELDIAKEHAKFRTELHDEFGQRLTLFQRTIGSQDPNLYENAEKLLDSMENVILKKEVVFNKNGFNNLLEFFKQMDVIIELQGDYPKNDLLKELLFYSARECTTNAVKHGGATKVAIKINYNSIIITNNGLLPQAQIVESSGLKGLRVIVEENGATMQIKTYPKMKVKIIIGDKHDKSISG